MYFRNNRAAAQGTEEELGDGERKMPGLAAGARGGNCGKQVLGREAHSLNLQPP